MQKDSDKLDLKEDLEELKEDLDKLSSDVASLVRKATIGQVEKKVARSPFSYILMAFGAGVLYGMYHKFFGSRK